MSNEKRLKSEKEFHNETFAKNTRSAAKKYYKSASESKGKYHSLIERDIKGKKVLEYGCGPGSSSFSLAKMGAKVTAIDISDVAIDQAREQAEEEGLDIEFYVMDAENLDFESNSFDVICGSGILHHLELGAAYKEISRTLKKDGRAIFFEPLGHNPIINLYRKLTPKMRTDDERSLLMKDIEMTQEYFESVNKYHFNLTSIISSFASFMNGPLSKLDEMLFNLLPGLKKYSWIVVLEFLGPKQ